MSILNPSYYRVKVGLSKVEERDALIAAKDSIIGSLQHRVDERDSVIVTLVMRESSQRDSVFIHLEDRFEEAEEEEKELLINEALNSIE